MKSLEEEGFTLEFPRYESNEQRIIELIKEKNERLFLALPLLLRYASSYEEIRKHLTSQEIKILNKHIIIARSLFKDENIDFTYIQKIIQQYNLSAPIKKKEYTYYHSAFTEALQKKKGTEQQILTTQIDLRTKLNLNKSLTILYSPAKRRIMEKIFNHELLTNTELKYYYRAIRPLIAAILNEQLQKYLRLIDSTKKYS